MQSHATLAALLFVATHASPTGAQDLDLYWADRWNNAHHRFTDRNGDGDYNDHGEVAFLIDPSHPSSFAPRGLQLTVEGNHAVAYWLAEFDDTIMRGIDRDGDGELAGPAEVTVFRDSGALDGQSWPQGLDLTDDGAVWWTAALVKAHPQNGISRLEDLNGDGDAADPGEQVVMVDGLAGHSVEHDGGSGPIEAWALQSIAAAGDGVIAFAEIGDHAVYRFEDLNGDGDVTDGGESILLLNATGVRPDFPMNPDFQSGKFKDMDMLSGYPTRFLYLASAMEHGQRAFYFGTDANAASVSWGTNINGQGMNFLIYRGVDQNGDRDVNDAGEVELFFDGSHTDGNPDLLTLRALAAAGEGVIYAVGILPYPVLFPGPDGNTWIHRFEDLNGDGDALDAGELQQGVFELQIHGATSLFPLPPAYGNVMADPYDLALSVGQLFEPAFAASGPGCALPGGPLPVAAGSGSGVLGTSFTFHLDGAPPLATALWSYGTNTTSWFSLPLPLDLGPLGFPGCLLVHDLVGSVPTAVDAAGHAQLSIPLPVNPAVSGFELPTQWFAFGLGGEFQATGLGTLLLK